MKKKWMMLIGVAVWLQLCPPLQAKPLYISAAASMTDAFNEIIDLFSDKYSNVRVLSNFGSSGTLAKQIVQGAPVEIFVSANPQWIAYLVDKKKAASQHITSFAYNTLVFLGDPKLKVSKIEHITSIKKIAIGSPRSVPAGQYAKQAMERAKIFMQMREAKKLVLAKDARQALLYADRGEVGGSFVYKTDALIAKNARILFTVPDELYSRIEYSIALTEKGAESKEAKLFYDFLGTAPCKQILLKYGFD